MSKPRQDDQTPGPEYIGTAGEDTKLGEELGTEILINPGTLQIHAKTKPKVNVNDE